VRAESMDEQSDDVVIWKTSRRGVGERHLRDGYRAEDFPGTRGAQPDGNAYFAKDRWIAAEFAAHQLLGYEDFVIEIVLPRAIYEQSFQQYERPLILGWRQGTQLVIPAGELRVLNDSGKRMIASDFTTQNSN